MADQGDGLLKLCNGDAELANAIMQKCTIRNFKSRARLIEQGDLADNVYIILSGDASVVIYSRGGHELWLGDVKAGVLFGELAVLLSEPRTANVVATSSGRLAVMPGAAFEEVILASPKFARIVIGIQSRRVQLTSKRMFESNVLSVPGRVYAELLRVAEPDPDDDEVFIISPARSVVEFSRRVNATRESVSRAINDYEKAGLLTRTDDKWTVLAPNFDQ